MKTGINFLWGLPPPCTIAITDLDLRSVDLAKMGSDLKDLNTDSDSSCQSEHEY